ncbi:MAG: tRNA lysidine(34) synthetase TilS [Clostridia bacterium]|nr:tRNA lysidine(34) synthetase TilS [Clostridia bacterium]
MQINTALFERGDTIGVAVSGGRDSMSLLHYLSEEKNSLMINVVAIHVEHGIRGAESIEDQSFVREFCAARDIPLYAESVDVPKYAKENLVGVEQAARELRYKYFDELLKKGVVDKIATAHQLDDQCETVLMRIFRGTGVKGLEGIPSARSGKYIRPMLHLTRQEISEYCEANGVPHVEDSTNYNLEYTRNFIRHEVFPVVEKMFPQYRKSIERLTGAAKEAVAFMDSVAVPYDVDDKSRIVFSVKALREAHPALVRHSIRKAMIEQGLALDFEQCNLLDVLSLLNKETGKEVSLSQGLIAAKAPEHLMIMRAFETAPYEIPFKKGEVDLPNGTRLIVGDYHGVGLRFDPKKLPEGTVIRNRREGDIFTTFGGHTKTLGNYLTNIKYPGRDRDDLPLIACGKEILVICGVEISSKVKVDETTDDVFTVKVIHG